MNHLIKAYYLIIGLIICNTLNGFSQDQNIADSLRNIYDKEILFGVEKLELLRNLAFNESKNLELAERYADELIELSTVEKDYLYLHRGYLQKGNVNRRSGDLDKAIDAFFNSYESAVKGKYIDGQGSAYLSVADTYSEMGNPANAATYYKEAIKILRLGNNKITLAAALLNAGDEAFNNEEYKIALEYFEESGTIFKNEEYLIGTAYNLGNIGMVYAKQGKDKLAENNINEAITILEEFEDYYAISEYLTYMAEIYVGQDKLTNALAYAEKSLDMAESQGLKKQLSETNLLLSELHEKLGEPEASLNHYRNHITYRDSVRNLETIQNMANIEVSRKQAEVDLLSAQKRNQRIIMYATSITLFLIGLLALGLYRRNKFVRKTNRIIANEKERSDNLLLNILPEETAQELKENGKVKAKKIDSATVLFSDFKGFTSYAEGLSPEDLVKTVDFYFSKFDDIVEKHGLEKIKTIGDAYMCAGGLHGDKANHAQKMISAAFDMSEFVKQTKTQDKDGKTPFDIRIGINTGPVVAGVVGTKKFAYDIWGDTVNVASRMESNSEPGNINVSENTYEIIKDEFDCEFRGKLKVKNHGEMKMYFVNGLK